MTRETSTLQFLEPPQVCKAVVFSTAGHRFALPLNAIARIIHRALLQSDRTIEGLYYFESQPLEMVNLSELLVPSGANTNGATNLAPSSTPSSTQAQFLVLVPIADYQAGIAADAPPVLMDLPLETVHEVPSSYRSNLQGLASHMISLTPAGETATATATAASAMDTIFLLDLQRVATLMAPQPHTQSHPQSQTLSKTA